MRGEEGISDRGSRASVRALVAATRVVEEDEDDDGGIALGLERSGSKDGFLVGFGAAACFRRLSESFIRMLTSPVSGLEKMFAFMAESNLEARVAFINVEFNISKHDAQSLS